MGTRIFKISKYKPSIFQGSLKLAPGRRSFPGRTGFSLTIEHPAERIAFRTLVVTLVALACAYGYFVSASVLNVIARKEALAETVSLGSRVSLLERDYYAAAAAIIPSAGDRLGLAPVSNTRYVHRLGVVGTAEVQSNEI